MKTPQNQYTIVQQSEGYNDPIITIEEVIALVLTGQLKSCPTDEFKAFRPFSAKPDWEQTHPGQRFIKNNAKLIISKS